MKQWRGSSGAAGAKGNPRRPTGFWASATAPLVYANMPKSGCTTIKNLLYRIDSGAFLDDPLTIHGRPELMVHWKAQPEAIERRLKTDLVFTFVRHPLKRAYSCFNEKIHFRSIYSFGKARDLHRRRTTAPSSSRRPRSSCTGRTSSASCTSPRIPTTRPTAGAATRTGARSRRC